MTADSELVIFRKKRSGKSRREQEPTEPVSVETIMRCRAFVAGVKDARAGLSFHSDYERWEVNDQWNYERGRAWATLAPRNVALKRKGKLNARAVRWFISAGRGII
jgi:hypothetical protein